MNRSPKKSLSKTTQVKDQDDEEDVYGGLNASLTVIMHGIESDWIEEEMSDDDDFRFEHEPFKYKIKVLYRKDVLEQKVKKVLEEIGMTKKIVYKVFK